MSKVQKILEKLNRMVYKKFGFWSAKGQQQPLPTASLWENYLNFVTLIYFICKMG